MNTLELKQKIIEKLKSVDDADLLKEIMNLLQPVDPNEIKHLNANELEIVKDVDEDEDIKIISQEQLDKEDPEWITEI
ncbi:hypothetical protein [Flavobacterium aestivum]|uniref:hypothetical protein n=1 Tax=Flavobacterium aestivum TaxID=3003257 RepID=UPI002285B69A|nr:hypothetical protein [Flavobacterium aestivum]